MRVSHGAAACGARRLRIVFMASLAYTQVPSMLKASTVHISGETSFVNNSATSDIQLNTGGGQIVEHMEMSNR